MILVFFESEARVERLGAFVTLWKEMETYTTDVLLGTEGFGVVHLVALNFQLQQTPVWQTDAVAVAQMAIDDFSQGNNDALDGALVDMCPLGRLLENHLLANGLMVHGYGLVFAESRECRLGFFLYSVFHVCLAFGILLLRCKDTTFSRELQINQGKVSFKNFRENFWTSPYLDICVKVL